MGRHQVRQLASLAFLLVVASGCLTSPVSREETVTVLRITGAEEMVPVLQELAAAYSRRRPDVFVDVSGGGSQWGMRALFAGQADVGMVSYWPEDEELRSGRQRLVTVEIGRDGLALIVNPANPVRRVPRTALVAVFEGTTFRWEELGWKGGGEIAVITREPGAGARRVLERYLFGGVQGKISLNALVVPVPDAVVQRVAEEPAAIGYVGASRLSSAVRALAVEGVLPSLQQVADGTYPIVRPWLLVTRGRPRGLVRDFIDWTLGGEGQAIVARFGVPVRP